MDAIYAHARFDVDARSQWVGKDKKNQCWIVQRLGETRLRVHYVISKGHTRARWYIRGQRSDEAMAMKQNFPHVVLEEKDVPGASHH